MIKTFILSWVVLVGLASAVSSLDPLEAALQLRRETEVVQNPFFDLSSRFQLPDEEFKLKVEPVFPQGNTQFCWAYAALHTLRTYYSHTLGADAVWKNYLESFATTSQYKNYVLQQVGSTSIGGWPIEMVLFYKKSIGADVTENWTSYVPSETLEGFQPHPGPDLHSYTPEGYFMKRAQVVEKIYKSLAEGSAVAYCTPQHCVSIYGGKYRNGVALEYYIADSASGGTYTASASSVNPKIADITAPGE